MTRRTGRGALATLAIAALVLGACGAEETEEATTATEQSTPAGSPSPLTPTTAPATPTSATPPTGDVGEETVPALAVEEIVTGLDEPVFATTPPDDPSRLFVVERDGRVLVVELATGAVSDVPLLDIRDLTRTDGERGLLGLAFHPEYADNRRFFVHYSGVEDGDTRLAEYRADPDGGSVRADSGRLLLTVEQPASNHNGGMVTFGPDGMLYFALGDGGAAGDRFGNGQDPSTLLGTILRLDVDTEGDEPYAIPSDNPFASGGEGAPEVWAYGLRNPWRFSFDGRGDRLYVGDVGQNELEEIDVAPASAPGLNYGWPLMEGSACYDPPEGCRQEGLVLPALDYGRDGGACGVIGGYVYRGESIPALDGTYFYGDLCDGVVRSFRYSIGDTGFRQGGTVIEERRYDEEFGSLGSILSFARDVSGEVYVLTAEGVIYRIVVA